MSNEYCVRYGAESSIARTDYDTLKECIKYYEKLKNKNDVVWAEIIYVPLSEDDDEIYVIKAFEKDIVNIDPFGKFVRGIKEEIYDE